MFTCARFLFCIAVISTIFGQTPASKTKPDRGFYPAGSFSPSSFGTVNNVSGNLIATVPITELAPGPGGSRFPLSLVYNTSLYDTYPQYVSVPGETGYYRQLASISEHGGWQYGYKYGLYYDTRPAACSPTDASGEKVHKMYLRTPDGGTKVLSLRGYQDTNGDGYYAIGPQGQNGVCTGVAAPAGDLVYYTTDGSYIRVEISRTSTLEGCTHGGWQCKTWIAYFPDGSFAIGFGNAMSLYRDKNENEFYTVTYMDPDTDGPGPDDSDVVDLIQDQAGRAIYIVKDVDGIDEVWQERYGGTFRKWEIQWGNVTTTSGKDYFCADNLPTNFGSNYCAMQPMQVRTISKITLPFDDPSGYKADYLFQYSDASNGGWGELRSMEFPKRSLLGNGESRAKIQFDYKFDHYNPGVGPPVQPFRDFVAGFDNPVVRKVMTYRDGTALQGALRQEEWSYSLTYGSGSGFGEVTAPDGGKHRVLFYNSGNASDWKTGLVYEETFAGGRLIQRDWARNIPWGGAASNAQTNPYVSIESEGWRNPTNPQQTKMLGKFFTVDRNGNVTSIYEGDWLTSGLRYTTSTYIHSTSNAGGTAPSSNEANGYWNQIGPRLLGAVGRSRTMNGGGVTKQLQEYYYDSHWNVSEMVNWDSMKSVTAPTEPSSGSFGYLLSASGGSPNAVSSKVAYTTSNQTFFKGNPVSETDANGNRTDFEYGAIAQCNATQPTVSNLYPTRRIVGANASAQARTFDMTYDCNTGLVKSERDVDHGAETVRFYDFYGRPTLTKAPNGHETSYAYADDLNRVLESSDVREVGDRGRYTISQYDDLGRISLIQTSRHSEGLPINLATELRAGAPSVGSLVRHLYWAPCSPPGSTSCPAKRMEAVTRSYSATEGESALRHWTITEFDQLGRIENVKYVEGVGLPVPWGTLTGEKVRGTDVHTYSMETHTILAADGKETKQVSDGLGRLIEVVESPSDAQYAYSTTYVYDASSNLESVNQGGRNRSFVYTSLNRLWKATNPESGLITYLYDSGGNLTSKTDGRGTVTHSGYDALGRIGSKSYSSSLATGAVTYSYDNCGQFGKGRLCSVATAKASGGDENERTVVSYEYDIMGRPTRRTQKMGPVASTNGFSEVSHEVTQSYWISGLAREVTYPTSTFSQPRRVNYDYWPNGQVKDVRQGPAGSGSLYASFNGYDSAGAETSVALGNGVTESTQWLPQGQMKERNWALGANVLHQLEFGWIHPTTERNAGNLLKQTISGTRAGAAFSYVMDYEYDPLGRVLLVKDSGVTACGSASWRQHFAYDRWGNRALISGSCGDVGVEVAPAIPQTALSETIAQRAAAVQLHFPDNRWVDGSAGARHDASGNVVRAAGSTFAHDGEGHQTVAHAGGWTWKYRYNGEGKRVAVEKWGPAGFVETRRYVYDVNQELIAELSDAVPAGWARKYVGADYLGTTRVVMNSAGTDDALIGSRHDSFPFGDEVPNRGAGYGDEMLRIKFTGKERDAETGLVYLDARYLSSALGRFASPDVPFADQNEGDAQSWNLFAYARNNPLRFTDRTGRKVSVCVPGDGPSNGLYKIDCKDYSDDEYRRFLDKRTRDGEYPLPSLPTAGTNFAVMPISCGHAGCGVVVYENDSKGMEDQTLPLLMKVRNPVGSILGELLPEETVLVPLAVRRIEITPADRKAASELAGSLLRQFKRDGGVGQGSSGRSGGHGTPHLRVGAELRRRATLERNPSMKEALRVQADRMIQQGRGHNHK